MLDVLRLIVAEAYRSLARSDLVAGAEGSVAVAERSTGVALVTGAGLVAAEADANGVTEVALEDGLHRRGPAPTPHLPLHLAVLAAGHTASLLVRAPHVTALGLVRDAVPTVLVDQPALVGRPTPVLPLEDPDPARLGRRVAAVLAPDRRVVAVRHLGLVAAGPDLTTILAAAVTAEAAARAYLLAAPLGTPALLEG